ncbi:hypothetical protein FRB90_001109 [Tulasnella sp. 427]|nr:hypothetical protein FRB90_001109 [Tulasnella sp. 427]
MPVLGKIGNTFSDELRDAKVQLRWDKKRISKLVRETRSIDAEIERRELDTLKLKAEANVLIAQTDAIRAETCDIRRERQSYVVQLEQALPKNGRTAQLLCETREVLDKEDMDVDALRHVVTQHVLPEIVISAAPAEKVDIVSEPVQIAVCPSSQGCRARMLAALIGFFVMGSFVLLLK